MNTKLIKIEDTKQIKDEELAEAAQILRDGGLVAFPTETVYGLGANALDEAAAKKIYAAKGRPSDNPLIAHISCLEELKPLVAYIPETGRKLAEAYWPVPSPWYFQRVILCLMERQVVWIRWQSACQATRWQTD